MTDGGVTPVPAARPRSARFALGAIVLGFEIFIMFFFTLLAYGLELAPRVWVFPVGLTLCVLLLVTAGLLRVTRFGYTLGWVLQGIMLACGFLHPAMFVVGAMFVAMWVYAMKKGIELDSRNVDDTAAASGGEDG